MPKRAKVRSIEALESFRSSLIIYLEKADGALAEISEDVLRTRLWLENDQRDHWEREVRRRTKELEQKHEELLSAQLSNLRETKQAEIEAVQKTKRALEEADARLALVKQWNRQYDSRIQPLAQGADKLRDVLAGHMGRAVSYLAQAIKTLSAYADLASPDTPTRSVGVINQPREPDSTDTLSVPRDEVGHS